MIGHFRVGFQLAGYRSNEARKGVGRASLVPESDAEQEQLSTIGLQQLFDTMDAMDASPRRCRRFHLDRAYRPLEIMPRPGWPSPAAYRPLASCVRHQPYTQEPQL